jgi:hypothetical protein
MLAAILLALLFGRDVALDMMGVMAVIWVMTAGAFMTVAYFGPPPLAALKPCAGQQVIRPALI